MRVLGLFAVIWFLFASSVFAGDIAVSGAKIRATPEGAKVSAGYIKIKNNSKVDDRLIGASSSIAKMTEAHTMKMEDNIMKMRPLQDGIAIPGGHEVELKPGAEHLMFMKLTEKMNVGEKKMVKLIFEKAGEMEIEFEVVEVK